MWNEQQSKRVGPFEVKGKTVQYQEKFLLQLMHQRFCMKYLNTLNKVQIDQKSAVGLPTVPAYCLTITLNFLLC